MRKIYFLLVFFFIAGLSFAQNQVQVSLSQAPPNQLRTTDLWKAMLINTTKSTLHVTLFGTLEAKGEGTVVDGKSVLMSLPPGAKMITYNDVKTGSINIKPGKWSEAFNRTGKAPSGDYTICLQVKAEDGRELGSSCIDQTIAAEVPVDVTPHLSVKLIPPPPNQLKSTDLWKIVATNASAVGYTAALITVNLTEKSSGVQVESKLRSVTIAGSKSFSFRDFIAADLTYRNSKLQEAFSKNMNAPDGNYTICISVKNERGEELAKDCIDQTVKTTIPEAISPHLISPSDGSKLNSIQPVLFTWMVPSVKPGANIIYKMKLVEILGNQSPSEAVKQNPALFEKNDIRTTMLQYPVSAKKLEMGKKYAWNVRVMNIEEQSVGEYGSTSESFMFDTESNNVTKSLIVPTTQDSTTSSTGTGTAAVGDTIKAGYNGEFKVIVTDAAIETDGSLTGKGRVHINWLGTNVAVEFKKIRVDTTKRLTSGGIVTTESGSSSTSYLAYPLAWAQSLLTGPGVANVEDKLVHWTNGKIDNLVNWVNGLNYGQPQINYKANVPPPVLPDYSLKMPFGLQFNNGNQKLVITEMVFKKDSSKVNFLAQEKFTKSGTPYTLGFAGKYFPIHPSSINFSSGRVELAEDIKIPTAKMKFNFKKGTSNSGCYVEWDSTGVKDISLALEVKFTRDWLLRTTAPLTDSVKATIAGNGTNMHDIMLTGSLDSCEIVGTNGIKIQSSPIFLDLSDSRNPLNMHFPKNYPNDSTITWQGFYVKSFVFTLPDTWKTGTNLTAPIVTASNFVIDDMGLTTKIKAVNIFNLQSGRIADLSASLDTVEISIISSSLVSGKAKGLLVLPISSVSAQNSLKYTATFNQVSGANNFQIAILPVGPIDADILKGKMTLLPTSNISASISSASKTLSVNLNGTFKWDNPILSVPSTNNTVGTMHIRTPGIKGIKMEMAFENIGLTYTNSSNTNTLAFNPGTWSFASPPKWLANFPVTIKKIYYKSLSNSPGTDEIVKGALMMDIVANLTDNIGGSTTIGAAFAVEFNKPTIKFTPKFKGIFIDSLSVHADIPAVKIDGYLKLYEDHPIFGSGFDASIDVTFTAVSLQAKALVQFGNTTYNNNNQFYRYWRVEADVLLPVGIPFLTGVGFYGFGGGAYYNMEAIHKTNSPKVSNAYTFEPKYGFKGLKVSATIGTMPKVETFNADVSLSAQFNNNNGLDLIYFTGDFWLATKLADRPSSKINGGVVVSYTFPTKVFYMGADLNINVTEGSTSVIKTTTPAQFSLNIDGRNNKWAFIFGTPTLPNTVSIFNIPLYSYLMFGNDIPVPSGFTPKFKAGYLAAIGSSPTIGANFGTGGVNDNTKTGKGIATGVGISFDKTYNYNIHKGLCRQWSIDAALNVGAELNLSFMDQTGCVGINGYRASGNVGLYFNLTTTINGTSFHPKLCNSISSNLFSIKIGAWLGGEFPNPVYLYGSISGTIGIFDDLLHVSFNESFTYGTNCVGTTVATANAAAEDKAADLKNKLIQRVTPDTHYNFPTVSTINVKYALVPDQVFDVAENQGDGTIKNRTFKMVITKSLEVQNTNGTWAAKTLQSKVNNIGEWQYWVKVPLPTTASQVSNQIAKPITTLINTNSGNTLVSTNGTLKLTSIPSPVPPPPTPNYPNPMPDPVNNLVDNMEYRFIVTATLMELLSTDVPNTGVNAGRGTGFHTELTWTPAKTRTGVAIKETKTVLFRTGGIPLAQVNSVGNQVH